MFLVTIEPQFRLNQPPEYQMSPMSPMNRFASVILFLCFASISQFANAANSVLKEKLASKVSYGEKTVLFQYWYCGSRESQALLAMKAYMEENFNVISKNTNR